MSQAIKFTHPKYPICDCTECCQAQVNINFVEAENLTSKNIRKTLKNADAVLVPGGFGERGVEGMILGLL